MGYKLAESEWPPKVQAIHDDQSNSPGYDTRADLIETLRYIRLVRIHEWNSIKEIRCLLFIYLNISIEILHLQN